MKYLIAIIATCQVDLGDIGDPAENTVRDLLVEFDSESIEDARETARELISTFKDSLPEKIVSPFSSNSEVDIKVIFTKVCTL